MKNKEYMRKVIMTTAISCIPFLIGLYLMDKLPDQIPVHFDFHGNVDRYGSKFEILLLMLMLPAFHLLCAFVTGKDPKAANVSGKVHDLVLWIIPCLSFVLSFLVYGKALGLDIDVRLLMSCLVSVLFIVIGNYMPKTRQNYTIGIKIPWTLADAENWDRTHRLAGYLFIFCGIVMFLSIFVKTDAFMWILLAACLIAVFVPVIYSYRMYQKKKES